MPLRRDLALQQVFIDLLDLLGKHLGLHKLFHEIQVFYMNFIPLGHLLFHVVPRLLYVDDLFVVADQVFKLVQVFREKGFHVPVVNTI